MTRNQRDENLVIDGNADIRITTQHITENATNNVTISNVAPAAVGTATISRWLRIDISDVSYYIPLWT